MFFVRPKRQQHEEIKAIALRLKMYLYCWWHKLVSESFLTVALWHIKNITNYCYYANIRFCSETLFLLSCSGVCANSRGLRIEGRQDGETDLKSEKIFHFKLQQHKIWAALFGIWRCLCLSLLLSFLYFCLLLRGFFFLTRVDFEDHVTAGEGCRRRKTFHISHLHNATKDPCNSHRRPSWETFCCSDLILCNFFMLDLHLRHIMERGLITSLFSFAYNVASQSKSTRLAKPFNRQRRSWITHTHTHTRHSQIIPKKWSSQYYLFRKK